LTCFLTFEKVENPSATLIRPMTIGHDHKHIFSAQHLPLFEIATFSSSEGHLPEVEITVVLGVYRGQGVVYSLSQVVSSTRQEMWYSVRKVTAIGTR
jgi:hypothetical protein